MDVGIRRGFRVSEEVEVEVRVRVLSDVVVVYAVVSVVGREQDLEKANSGGGCKGTHGLGVFHMEEEEEESSRLSAKEGARRGDGLGEEEGDMVWKCCWWRGEWSGEKEKVEAETGEEGEINEAVLSIGFGIWDWGFGFGFGLDWKKK